MQRPLCFALLTALTLVAPLAARGDFTFGYNGHSYILVTTPRNWDSAHSDAVARGGALARIDDAAENQAILTNLLGKGIAATASDGGNAVYVWIGGRELTEGSYAWISRASNATSFWVGGKNGAPTNGLYANWGRGTPSSAGPEPDNYNSLQNRAGFALEAWPRSGTTKIGQAGQWNDIYGTDQLCYLVERAPPGAPSNLTVTVTSPTAFTLNWADTADNETGFAIGYRTDPSGAFYQLGNPLAANTTSQSFSGAAIGTTYQFVVEAYNDLGVGDSPIVSVTMPGLTSRGYHPAVVGQSFSYTLTASSDGAAPESFDLVGLLPEGLTFSAATRQITGAPARSGVFNLTMQVRYPAWGVLSKPLVLRVIHPPGAPVISAPIPRQTLQPTGSVLSLPLNAYFADPDTERAVRFATTKGTFDVALHATATPQTVSNFLNYVARADFDDSIVHRSVPGFIVQGGGFKPAPPNLTRIPTDPSPTNEPGISNLRGTVAMAKLGGNPNSATDQWFVNLSDNSANLDNQNGGFTAFGRVCGGGLAVAEAIAALPRASYLVNVDGAATEFDDWPMDTPPPAPPTLDQTKLVLVNSVARIEPLTFAVSGSSVTGLVSLAIEGTNLVIAPTNLFGGLTLVSVRATDLDGNSVTQSVTIEVSTAYSAWLAARAVPVAAADPLADPEADGIPNAAEFVLGGDPAAADQAAVLPRAGFVDLGGQRHATLSFKLRKDSGGAVAVIRAAADLQTGSWQQLWKSDEPASPWLLERLDRGEHWELTLQDPLPLAGAAARFLKIEVALP